LVCLQLRFTQAKRYVQKFRVMFLIDVIAVSMLNGGRPRVNHIRANLEVWY
jgi:hypothetical protein